MALTMYPKQCAKCGVTFEVPSPRRKRAKFCSKRCLGAANGERIRGNKFRLGLEPGHKFPKGHVPWNLGVKGLRFSPATEFKPGERLTAVDVGTEKVRNDKSGKPRCWVKVAEPNKWRPRAQLVWEAARGPIPPKHIVHHENRNTFDDTIENLEIVTRAQHLAEHRHEFAEKAARAAADARWGTNRKGNTARARMEAEAAGSTLRAAQAGQEALFR